MIAPLWGEADEDQRIAGLEGRRPHDRRERLVFPAAIRAARFCRAGVTCAAPVRCACCRI